MRVSAKLMELEVTLSEISQTQKTNIVWLLQYAESGFGGGQRSMKCAVR